MRCYGVAPILMSNLHRNFEESEMLHLAATARKVLADNRLGSFTKPAPALYPHQWNWDAGFIALGYARSDFRQACSELTSLFRGQWSSGMVPQIVFSVQNVGKYFPGYFFWNTRGVPEKPRNTRTSGITMPPVHGFILNRLLQTGSINKPRLISSGSGWAAPRSCWAGCAGSCAAGPPPSGPGLRAGSSRRPRRSVRGG